MGGRAQCHFFPVRKALEVLLYQPQCTDGMTLTPHVGTGDSAGRRRRYLCSTVLKFVRYVTVFEKNYSPYDIYELLPTPKETQFEFVSCDSDN